MTIMGNLMSKIIIRCGRFFYWAYFFSFNQHNVTMQNIRNKIDENIIISQEKKS